jgi:DNA-binding transcriptional LysR family regulator
MEFLQLKYFQVVAKHEHMTKAAEELLISQPSLSKTIATLEKDLGVPLFVRKGRHIELSQFGRVFLEYVERTFFELNKGKRSIKDMISEDSGNVSIAVTLPILLPIILESFLRKHPLITIQQYDLSSLDIKRQLEKGYIDLCLSTIPINDPNIEWLPVFEEEIFLSVPNHHPLSKQKNITLAEVKNEQFISVSSKYAFRDVTDHFCKSAGFIPKIRVEVEEPGAVQELVSKGLGITFTPATYLLGLSPSRPVTELYITDPICKRTIGIAWHKNNYMPHSVKHFIEFIVDFFGNFNVFINLIKK